jgi:hypothetical protein
MTKLEAVKSIYYWLKYKDMIGGLPRAVEIYNYLTGGGTIEITKKDIRGYFYR